MVEFDRECVPVPWGVVAGAGTTTVQLIDEVVERRGTVLLATQVVDDLTSVSVGDEL